MAFSPDGSLVTTRHDDRTMLWNTDLEPMRRYDVGGDAVAVSPDLFTAALTENDDGALTGDVSFLDLRTGDVRAGSGGHEGTYISRYEAAGLAFSPDGGSVITVGNDGRMLIWDVASATVRERFTDSASLPLRGPVLSPDGSTAFTTDRNREVVVWNLSDRDRIDRPFEAGPGLEEWPYFAMSPDGRMIAVASASNRNFGRSGAIRLIDLSDLHVVRTIAYTGSSPLALAFSPDSSSLAVGSYSCSEPDDQGGCAVRQAIMEVWDVRSGRAAPSSLPELPSNTQILSVSYSPDGSMLAAGGADFNRNIALVYVWDLNRAGAPVHFDMCDRQCNETNQVLFSPDGSRIIAGDGFGDGGDVVFWDTRSQQVEGRFRADAAGVWSLDVSNDGRTLVTGGQTAGVERWNVTDVASVSPLGPSFTGLVASDSSVDLGPDGTQVVGSDIAGTVVLWDVASGGAIGDPFPGPRSKDIVSASFTPDGHHVVVVADSGAGWVWDVDPADWARRACEVAGRSMTEQEWSELLPDRSYHATCAS